MDVDLCALGLTPVQAAVLAAVAAEGDTTAPAVSGRTGVSRPQVSTALAVLEERGLVARVHGRRPEPVRLADRLESSLEAALALVAAERDRDAERAEQAAAFLREACASRSSRPRPDVRRLEPGLLGPQWQLARRTLDAVSRADDLDVLNGGPYALPGRRDRLIVVGTPPDRPLRNLRARGVDVRLTAEVLPRLRIVDGDRARVDVAADLRGGRAGWTWDAPQVAALRRLFELWWAEAA